MPLGSTWPPMANGANNFTPIYVKLHYFDLFVQQCHANLGIHQRNQYEQGLLDIQSCKTSLSPIQTFQGKWSIQFPIDNIRRPIYRSPHPVTIQPNIRLWWCFFSNHLHIQFPAPKSPESQSRRYQALKYTRLILILILSLKERDKKGNFKIILLLQIMFIYDVKQILTILAKTNLP